jgi:hypothetical protein
VRSNKCTNEAPNNPSFFPPNEAPNNPSFFFPNERFTIEHPYYCQPND